MLNTSAISSQMKTELCWAKHAVYFISEDMLNTSAILSQNICFKSSTPVILLENKKTRLNLFFAVDFSLR